jgi:hypothetical protein
LFVPTDKPPDFVLDTTVTMAWLIGGAGAIDPFHVLRLLSSAVPIVPVTWPTDVVDGMLAAGRRATASKDRADNFLGRFDTFTFLSDAERLNLVGPAVAALGRRHRLRVGPAATLELAARSQLPLATIDTRLRAAAARAGVALFTP